ncbi:MAG: hypothetical protein CVU31_00385 [Betaproteobacteria bacterium HGW-Betaproteobacteria-4]|jgi:3-oxo-5alpha-steroid 4-dehydrogenase|nr:MAG: hypothetical protein CVU31_00385 [Betaproteobacteria bacterium HGW-Betaproteobacteria-4]
MTNTENVLLETTQVQSALTVRSAADVEWAEEADLVVVGFGGAGVSAALQGAESGGHVIAIDRFDGGGATAYCGGVFYASDTSIQREAGVTDSADEMEKYLAAESAPVQADTLKRFCQGSSADFDWVNRYVPFSGALYTGKAQYPPEGKFLYYSGNEKVPKYAEVAKPAPRGHRALGAGYTGNVFFEGLRKAAMEAGVKLITHAPVRRLVMDTEGQILGVEVHRIRPDAIDEHQKLYSEVNPQMPFKGLQYQVAIEKCQKFEAENSEPAFIRAHRGVVLSTGGFVYNLELLRQHRPEMASAYGEILRLGSPGCDGSGMALGATAGGYVDLMKNMFIGKTTSPPESLLHGLLINAEGKRFISEDAYVSVVGGAVAEQPNNGTAYLVLDAKSFWSAFWNALTIGRSMFLFFGLPTLLNILKGGTRRSGSLQGLAKKLGLPGKTLQDTVQRYNEFIITGKSDPFGKQPANIAPIGKGPYYALNMSIRNKFSLTPVFTLGGLRVNEETGGVLRRDGSTVSGLYAAGRTAVGLCSAGYMSGMSLADLVFSGRRAAMHALGQQ